MFHVYGASFFIPYEASLLYGVIRLLHWERSITGQAHFYILLLIELVFCSC